MLVQGPLARVSFGVFEVNLAACEVRKHGVKVRLGGQPLEVLVHLLERPGEIITRQELQASLWSGDTFVDFEHGVNTAIKKLRAVLGDSPENPRYIETIPRVGYRFIAPVRLLSGVNGAAATPASGDTPTPSDPGLVDVVAPAHRGLYLRVTKAAAVALLAATTIGVAGIWRPHAVPRVLGSEALTNSSRIDRWGRLQTDGARLFFLERQGHRWALMQMPLSGGQPQTFSAPFPNTRILAVSPDQAEMIVAPFTARSDSLDLWLMSTVGGQARRLGTVTASEATFGPQSGEFTYATSDGIYISGKEGANPRQLISMTGRKAALGWSPDGHLLRFEREDPKDEADAIWETDARGTGPHLLLPGWDDRASQCCGRWTPDGRYYIFVSHNHGGTQNIWALATHRSVWFAGRRVPVRLSTGPITMDQPLPSSDGRRLLVLGSNERSEYMLLDLASGQYKSLLGGANALCESFSADGEWVAYCSDNALWLSRTDGSDRRELASAWFGPVRPRFSPNGKEVAFEGRAGTGGPRGVYLVSTDGSSPRELVSEPFETAAPCWSPDGSVLLYSVPISSGPLAGLYLFDRKTEKKTRVPDSGGFWKTSWSPDGKFLAALHEDGHAIAIFDWRSQRWTAFGKGGALGPAVWSPDSRYIYFQDLVEENQPVHRVSVDTKKVDRVFDCTAILQGVQRCGFEDITPDGSLVLRLTRGDHDVYELDVELP